MLIDTCLPGQDSAEAKLARHATHYGTDLIILPFAEAWQRHETAAKSEPEEISSEQWHYALNVLPPVSWHDGFGESFKISERTTGSITSIYVRLNDRHFTFSDDIRTPHDKCCKRVFHSPAYRTTAQASGIAPLRARDDMER